MALARTRRLPITGCLNVAKENELLGGLTRFDGAMSGYGDMY